MHDEATLGIEFTNRVQTLDEATGLFDLFECSRAHTCHEVHVGRDVRAVCDLNAIARVG